MYTLIQQCSFILRRCHRVSLKKGHNRFVSLFSLPAQDLIPSKNRAARAETGSRTRLRRRGGEGPGVAAAAAGISSAPFPKAGASSASSTAARRRRPWTRVDCGNDRLG